MYSSLIPYFLKPFKPFKKVKETIPQPVYVVMSLLNLGLSRLYQNKINSGLNNLTKYVVSKTLSQQAPPC